MISKHSKQAPALTCALSSPWLYKKPPSWGSFATSAAGLVHPHQPDSPAIQAGKALEGSMVTSLICGHKGTSMEARRVRTVWCPPPTVTLRCGWTCTWTKERNQTQALPGSRADLWPILDAGFQKTNQEWGSMTLSGPGSDNQRQRVTPESLVIVLFTKPPF